MDYKEKIRLAKEALDSGSYDKETIEYIFPELKQSEDERIRKSLLVYFAKFKSSDMWDADFSFGDIVAWLKKEVEPRFEIGDLITNGILVGKIDEIHEWGYHAYFGDHYADVPDAENWHKWTIEDAKAGDVVVDKSDGTVGIFQSIGHHPDGGSCNDPSYCFLHCRYDDGFFYADFEHGNTIDSDDLIPATKEQYDLLFQKMREAGYEWNAEKKELKKIEQKPTELGENRSKELSLSLQIQAYLNTASDELYAKGKPLYSEKRLEDIHKCMLMWQKLHNAYFYHNPVEWSEEDEKIISDAEVWLDTLCDFLKDSSSAYIPNVRVIISKLKSLKDRVQSKPQWKPSDEQMEEFSGLLDEINWDGAILVSLYNDLKKLKEE